MAFDLNRWRSGVRGWWAENTTRLESLSIESAYAALVTSAWLPFFAAYAQQRGEAIQVFSGITAGIGANLVANVVQNRYDQTRAGRAAMRSSRWR